MNKKNNILNILYAHTRINAFAKKETNVNLLISKNIAKVILIKKNAANGQQLALLYVYDIRPKMVNSPTSI